MALKRRLVQALVRQFGHPRDAGGHVAGWVMARRPSNVQRSRWAVGLLDIRPGERVIEVGCGPGVAVEAAARQGAWVAGVDRSAVMIGHARRRNRAGLRDGRVAFFHAPVEQLPALEGGFDKALAVNTVGFWANPVAGLTSIGALLRPGGTVAVVSQPRCPGATAADSRAAADELERLLAEAGFVDLRLERLDLTPPAVCVLGRTPSDRPQEAGGAGARA